MDKIEKEFDNLLNNYSELEDESDKLLKKFKKLTSKPFTIRNLELCNETKDKFNKNHLKSTIMLDKLKDLIETPCANYFWGKTYDEKLSELHDKSFEIYKADKKFWKPSKELRKTQTSKVLYLSTIFAASLAYLMSK